MLMRAMREGAAAPSLLRRLSCVGAAAVTILVVAASASAHAVVRPSASRPAELQLYTLVVPTERDVPTVEVDLKVPDGIDFLLVDKAAGWSTRLVRIGDRIDQVQWKGASVPPKFYATFTFIARNPLLASSLSWKIIQRYSDGKAVRWIGQPESDAPAATTTITEKAVPVDVVAGLNGGPQSSATYDPAANATAAPSTQGGGERDGLTLALAIAACVIATVALVGWLSTLRRRSDA
jgi:uncharacterized protein YcnI